MGNIMRISEQNYDEFAEDHFPNMALVREWDDCRIWSAGVEQHLLVLVDTVSKRVAIFDYDSTDERDEDIQMVLRLRDGGGGDDKGVPAFVRPTPPARPAKNAQPLPEATDTRD